MALLQIPGLPGATELILMVLVLAVYIGLPALAWYSSTTFSTVNAATRSGFPNSNAGSRHWNPNYPRNNA